MRRCEHCGTVLGISCGDAEPDYNSSFCSKGCFLSATQDPDEPYCVKCGDLIDSASKGCQSAGDGEGCKGWDYHRDVLGFEPVTVTH